MNENEGVNFLTCCLTDFPTFGLPDSCSIALPDVQVCDATDDEQSGVAGNKKLNGKKRKDGGAVVLLHFIAFKSLVIVAGRMLEHKDAAGFKQFFFYDQFG